MYTYNLTRRRKDSCCCAQRDKIRSKRTIHGATHLPEYKIWVGIKDRCYNQNSPNYYKYGKRGIKVSNEWCLFECFYADMGPRPSRLHSIERLDNDGDYRKGNCTWATALEQGSNRRSNRLLEFRGKIQSMAQWSREVGLPRKCLEMRLNDLHWSVDKALTEPWKPRKPIGKPITYNGVTKPMAEWANEIGVTEHCIERRLGELKWSIEKALTKPPRKRRS